MSRFYFDHAAASPVHPDVIRAMVGVMEGAAANASSIHAHGQAARRQLVRARDCISEIVGCGSTELVFTSGGTESDNIALIGGAKAQRRRGRTHLVTTAVEHHAVLHTCKWLCETEGFELTIVPVDEFGQVDSAAIAGAIRPDTALVSVMHGNNEVGTLQPIASIGEVVKARGALFHVDAVQTLAFADYRLAQLPVDLMSFSAHKINGPQGVGALYVAQGTPFEPQQHGGLQERKRRAGTENIAGIVGFAEALKICAQERKKKQPFLDKLRNKWIELLCAEMGTDKVVVNGHPTERLPHIANVSFVGANTESMLMSLDMEGIAAASGSACTSGSLEKSHVLKAMGLSDERLDSAVRFSFGLGNTEEELELAAPIVARVAGRIRSKNPEGR